MLAPGIGAQVSPIGALDRVGPLDIAAAARLASNGRVYDLGLEMNESTPQGGTPFVFTWRCTPEGTGAMSAFQYSMEAISGSLHAGTHLDGLTHIQAEGRIYGGGLASELRGDTGWRKYGMETCPPIVGRCVLLDVAGSKSLPALPDEYEITLGDIQAALAAAKVMVRKGDTVLVRTGKVRDYYSDPRRFLAAAPGVGREAGLWLYEQGMAVLGTDTAGTDPLPLKDPANTLHRVLIVERGVLFVENLALDDLARDKIGEALFVCLPLKITGATGSWVRPIAVA